MTISGASAAPAKAAASAPERRWRLLARALVAVAVVVALLVALQPWWLAPIVAHRLSASSGRAVQVDAMWFALSASFAPVLQLRGIRVDNAPWADRGRPFVSLAAATMVFSWRSVAEQRPVVALVVLRDGEVDLERRSDGLRNWRLAHPDDRAPSRFKVLAIRGERATLRFRHEPLALDFEARAVPNGEGDGRGDALPTHLDVRGAWRGVRFSVDATTAETITLLETGRTFAVRGRLEAGEARLDVDGAIGDIARWPEVDARIGLAAPSVARLVALVEGGAAASARSPLRLEATLRGGRDGYALSALHARLGTSDAAGEVRWQRGEDRNAVRATLASELLDVGEVSAVLRRPNGSARVLAASSPSGAVQPAATAASAVARPTEVELHVTARRLHAEGMPAMHDAVLDASLAAGTLRVARAAFAIATGRVAGKGTIELARQPLVVDAEVDVGALPIAPLFGERAAKRELSGVLNGHAALRASGDSLDALLASAAGTLGASVSEGTISSLLDAEMGLQGGRILKGLVRGAEPIALRCAAAVVDVEHGRGRIRSLVIDSDRTHTTGTGTVDFARRTVDVVLTPEAKQPGLFILDRSIHVHGAIAEPGHELVARAAPARPRGCAAPPPSGASACSCRTGSR
jgi:hypothetical protein